MTGPAPAPRKAERKLADLGLRTISAAVMGAVSLAALAWGGWPFAILLSAAAFAMVWELRRMRAPRFDALGWIVALGAAGACIITELSFMRWGMLWLALALAPLAILWARGKAGPVTLVGGLYIAAACAAFVGLRDDDHYGFEAALWVIITVMAADIGGYFGGRLIGGAKLWPAVSPGKTWSGFLAGIGFAAAVGAVFAAATTGTFAHEVAIVSAAIAVVSVGGDLAESRLKRVCGVKDSSNLIPGHGGVLDRMDGMLAAALLASLISFARGQSVFIW
ncbi:phosphatidate cytidylyltransferase [Rhodovulum sp. DZ06]|uniref:phosphatidate cytidylyltransferase n=1 Tax=Rhodovulum sp. DZ06 TaxID=3425126 RepID=UPI003D3307B0